MQQKAFWWWNTRLAVRRRQRAGRFTEVLIQTLVGFVDLRALHLLWEELLEYGVQDPLLRAVRSVQPEHELVLVSRTCSQFTLIKQPSVAGPVHSLYGDHRTILLFFADDVVLLTLCYWGGVDVKSEAAECHIIPPSWKLWFSADTQRTLILLMSQRKVECEIDRQLSTYPPPLTEVEVVSMERVLLRLLSSG